MSRYNKLWVAIGGMVAQAITQGLIAGKAAVWASVIIGSLAAAGVFGATNS